MTSGWTPPLLRSRHGSPGQRVLAGDVLDQLGAEGRALASRVLLVTDAGLRATPWVTRAVASLTDAGVAVVHAPDATPDACDDDVVAATATLAASSFDAVVALGGGSVLDTAKGVALLRTNGGRMEDWWGFGKAVAPAVPLLAVPTTSGTGSEAQSFAVIRRARDGQKMACGTTSLRPRTVLLDPRIAVGVPREVARTSGLDALGHALETAVCTVGSPEVTAVAVETAAVLLVDLPAAVDGDPAARARVHLAAHVAGLCIEASMLGAAHACANALSAVLGTPHGTAVGAMLARVVRHNAALPHAASVYADIATRAGLGASALALADGLDVLHVRLGSAGSPGAVGVTSDVVPTLVEVASRQWTGTFNPVTPDWSGLLSP